MKLDRSTVYIVAGAIGVTVAIFCFVDEQPWFNIAIPGVLGTILVLGGIARRRL